MSEKTCSRCREAWPLDAEFFRPRTVGGGRFFSWCRACEAEHKSQSRAAKAVTTAPSAGQPAALLTLAEAADRVGVSVRTLEREVAAGRLGIVRIRSLRKVDPAELDRYIAASQVRACRFENEGIATKSASASAAVNALNELFQRAQRSQTPARSKSRLAARASTLRLVGGRNT